jgi:hypothetical protein
MVTMDQEAFDQLVELLVKAALDELKKYHGGFRYAGWPRLH